MALTVAVEGEDGGYGEYNKGEEREGDDNSSSMAVVVCLSVVLWEE